MVKIQSSVMLYGDELIWLLDPDDGGSTILQNLSKQSTIRKNVCVCLCVCVTEEMKLQIFLNSSRNIYDENFILLVHDVAFGTSESRSDIP